MSLKILEYNPVLKPFESDLQLRMSNLENTRKRILKEGETLREFANGHMFYGFHRTDDGWYYREWAPAAEAMYLTGDFNFWDRRSHPMKKLDNGVWEIFLPGRDALKHGQRIGCIVVHNGQDLDRIPTYAKYVVQDPKDISWSAVIHAPEEKFVWTDKNFKSDKNLFIYECHIGMAQEEGKVSSYKEFEEKTLPRIKALGYNTIQIMAIMEHPYYGSFGYQVCNFFAASSKFGTPEDLKHLVNTAHKLGITVLLDLVHSHCAPNSREGLNLFDGTAYQYFHDGARGDHTAWGTKCFNYGKSEVLHFLLTNLKFWMDEYHFDGFRFDGVTSMLYQDHGLGTSFDNPSKYFSMNTDTEAVTYLQLASQLVKEVNPDAILIAEDMSAMPGMCLPIEEGGIGFDYRLAMGLPDMWIRLLKEKRDEDWDFNQIYFELANGWPNEKVIGYVESHDQALVGDKTMMMRLADAEMYTGMQKHYHTDTMDRATALHKMIRLLTMSLGGRGYLTFMGNEFGHPEWIDFPREGNGWNYHYCRRQWSLVDNDDLKYQFLNAFDKDMVAMAKRHKVLPGKDKQLLVHNSDHVLVYKKGGATFVYNFDPSRSYDGYLVPMAEEGDYQVTMSTDDHCYGGFGRVYHQTYTATKQPDGRIGFQVYLPSRTAFVLKKLPKAKAAKK
ncbi:MAG: alpha amylase C-terminal domain-containing protein [Oscillospiraceae bacterium]|nr:alpha amylase C-terminal domain-containing protein [Oscillospiraceae bacterium]